MSDYMVTDTELTAVADAIRTKGGTQEPIEWYSGFVDAIDDISTGGNVEPDGTYPDMTVGGLMGDGPTDQVPYNFRRSGGGVKVGNREIDAVTGGSLVWNQLVQNGNFADESLWGQSGTQSFTVNGNVGTFTVNAQNGSLLHNISIIVGHKYFVTADVKLTTATTSVRLNTYTLTSPYDSTSVNTEANTGWQTLSMLISPSMNYTYVLRIIDARSSGWDAINVRNVMFIDLTAMFGSTIADYIYALEQANAGAGVTWFRKLFPKPYYEYAPVGIESVKAGSHVTTGFNQWDEEWELGIWNSSGGKSDSSVAIRSKNYIHVIPGATYYIKSSKQLIIRELDYNKNLIKTDSGVQNVTITVSNETAFIVLCTKADDNVTSYNHDICINLHWDGERDGEYEPYVKHTYPLDSSLTLRGIPKLDSSNRLYYDGDSYASDGTVTRRYGIVDLGTLTWTIINGTNHIAYLSFTDAKHSDNSYLMNGICSKYPIITRVSAGYSAPYTVEGVCIDTNGNLVIFYPNNDWNTLSAIQTALSGVYLVYELATPTTEQADSYTNPQIVDAWGTEEYTDYAYEAGDRDVAIPVGHLTEYNADLAEKIEGLPWDLSVIAPIENGATASQAYTAGQYFLKDNKLCKALTSIASGATFTLNTNYSITTVAAELYAAINA